MKNLHTLKINSIYLAEYEHISKILRLSNEIIQQNYYLLRANKLLDAEMKQNNEFLNRLKLGVRNIKFVDDDAGGSGDNVNNDWDAVSKLNMSFAEFIFPEPKSPAPKRAHANDSIISKRPASKQLCFESGPSAAALNLPCILLDETHVIASDDTLDTGERHEFTTAKPLFVPSKINKISNQTDAMKSILSNADTNSLYKKG